MRCFVPRQLESGGKVIHTEGAYQLVVTLSALFAFDAPEQLLPASELCKVVKAELGEGAVLDAGSTKQQSEVLVHGSCYVPEGAHQTSCSVRLELGPIDKTLQVVGDRFWRDEQPSAAQPFRVMPIDWRHTFGGPGHAENPDGKGSGTVEIEGTSLRARANIHDGKSSKPVSLAPLPESEDGNIAPLDQRLDEPLQGGEKFVIENMHPDKPRLEAAVPDLVCRCFATELAEEGALFHELEMQLDTLWLFPHLERGVAIYRGVMHVESEEAAEVLPVLAAFEDEAAPRDLKHYAGALKLRLKNNGAVEDNADIVPEWADAAPVEEPRLSDAGKKQAELVAKVRNEAQVALDKMRADLEKRGIDPDQHLPQTIPEPAEPPPPKKPGEIQAELEGKQAEVEQQIREQLGDKKHIDVEGALAKLGEPAAGPPPRFSAQAQLEKLRGMLEQAEKMKQPAGELEAKLADPAFEKQLVDAEQRISINYRRTAHHYPPFELDAEKATKLRNQVVAAHKAGEPLAGLDLAGADLAGLDLRGADLEGALLECAKLAGARLSGANLSKSVLAHADLAGADLSGVNFVDANLGGASLARADLSGADLSGAVTENADMKKADPTDAKLPADPSGVQRMKAEFDALAELPEPTMEDRTRLDS